MSEADLYQSKLEGKGLMRKFLLLSWVLFSVLTFGAVGAASSASAEEWLSLTGAKPTKAEPVLFDGLWAWHHKPPAILGGGSILIHCTGSFHGTIGPGPREDLITLALGLAGEQDAIKCEVSESTNSICKAGEAVTVTAINLSWATELLLINGVIYDHLFAEPGKSLPGFETTCKSIKINCTGLDRAKWDNNVAGEGALFLFLGEVTSNCNDGGTMTLLGHLVLLGWNVT